MRTLNMNAMLGPQDREEAHDKGGRETAWSEGPKALKIVLGLRPNRTINKARNVAPKPGTAIRGEKGGPFLC